MDTINPDQRPMPTDDPQLKQERALRLAWQQPTPPNLRDYLTPQVCADPDYCLALVSIDVRARRRARKPAAIDTYLREYPNLFRPKTEPVRAVFQNQLRYQIDEPSAAAATMTRKYGNAYADDIAIALERFLASDTPEETPTPATAAISASLPNNIKNYRVLRCIGVGGMGAVYEAEQHEPKRRVAIKVIRSDRASEEVLRRFAREAETLARLEHPNIAHIYECGQISIDNATRPFFAMQYVDGRRLDAHVAHFNLTIHERLELLEKICNALQYAHQRGVIHRDLKPANILVTEAGEPIVMDFGVARITESDVETTTMETEMGVIIGTLAYMAPEQTLGDPNKLDTRVDVYAIGVIAYLVLAGRHPFDLKNHMMIDAIRAIREETPPPLSSIDKLLAGDVQTIIATALEKEPRRRYQSAAQLGDDIRRYLNNEPITARPPSPWYQFSKFVLRNKALVGVAALAILTLIGGTVASTIGFLRATESETVAKQAQSSAERARNRTADMAESLDAQLYNSRLEQAHLQILRANAKVAPDLLNACPTKYRGWEWHYVRRLAESKAVRYAEYKEAKSIAVSPDETLIAGVAGDNVIRIFETNDPTKRPIRIRCPKQVEHVAFSPDGSQILVAERGAQNELLAYDLKSQRLLWRAPGRHHASGIFFSPDGHLAITGSRKQPGMKHHVSFTDLKTGKENRAFPTASKAAHTLAVASDGTIATVGYLQHAIQLYTQDGAPTKTYRCSGRVNRMIFSSDSRLFAVSSPDGNLMIWDRKTDRVLLNHRYKEAIRAITFTPDNAKIAVSLISGLQIHSLSHQNRHTVINGVEGGCNQVFFIDEGQQLIVVDFLGLLAAQNTPFTRTIRKRAHSAPVTSIRFNSDGTRFVSAAGGTAHRDGDGDPSVRIWNSKSLEVFSFDAHPKVGPAVAGVYDATFSPKAPHLFTAGANRTVGVFDLNEMKQVAEWGRSWEAKNPPQRDKRGTSKAFGGDFESMVRAVAVSPDGKHLATATHKGDLSIWDAKTREPIVDLRGHFHGVFGVAVSPDNTLAAASAGDATVLYELATGKKLHTFVPRPENDQWSNRKRYSNDVAISPDGKQIAIASSGETSRFVQLYDLQTKQKTVRVNPSESAVYTVGFNQTGTYLATGGGRGEVIIWNAKTGAPVWRIRDHKTHVLSLDWSPTNPDLIAVASDSDRTTVWDVASRKAVCSIPSGSFAVKFLPDGQRFIAAHSQTVILYDTNTGNRIRKVTRLKERPRTLELSSDGQTIAIGNHRGGGVALVNIETGKQTHRFQDHDHQLVRLAFTSDQQHLISGSRDGSMVIRDLQNHKIAYRKYPEAHTTSQLLFTADGKRLLSSGADGCIAVWDTANWALLTRHHPHFKDATRMALSADASVLATCSGYDQTIKVFSFPDGELLHQFHDGTNVTGGLAITPDGTRLAATDSSRRLKIWDLPSGRLVFSTMLDLSAWTLTFDPKGHRLIVGDVGGNLHVLDGTPLPIKF